MQGCAALLAAAAGVLKRTGASTEPAGIQLSTVCLGMYKEAFIRWLRACCPLLAPVRGRLKSTWNCSPSGCCKVGSRARAVAHNRCPIQKAEIVTPSGSNPSWPVWRADGPGPLRSLSSRAKDLGSSDR